MKNFNKKDFLQHKKIKKKKKIENTISEVTILFLFRFGDVIKISEFKFDRNSTPDFNLIDECRLRKPPSPVSTLSKNSM